MKKLFLILLIAILAVSDAHHPFESGEERSWEDKVNNFLETIESDQNKMNWNIYNYIYKKRRDHREWNILQDDLKELIESDDEGAEEIDGYANKFCTQTMGYSDRTFVYHCSQFVKKFYQFLV